jgi:hypothetical protein
MAIDGEELTERTIVCLDDFLGLFPSGLLFFKPVHPVAVILILGLQFVGDYLPCQVGGRHIWYRGFRLGDCVLSEQKDRQYDGLEYVYQADSQWRRHRAAHFGPVVHLVFPAPIEDAARGFKLFGSAAVGGLAISIMERNHEKRWSKSRTLSRLFTGQGSAFYERVQQSQYHEAL